MGLGLCLGLGLSLGLGLGLGVRATIRVRVRIRVKVRVGIRVRVRVGVGVRGQGHLKGSVRFGFSTMCFDANRSLSQQPPKYVSKRTVPYPNEPFLSQQPYDQANRRVFQPVLYERWC